MICRNHVDVAEGVRLCARCRQPYCTDCLVTIQGQPYCAVCKTEKLLDVQSGSDAAVLRLASIGRRFAAQWVDSFIFSLPLMVVMFGGMMFFAFSHQGDRADPSPMFGIGVLALIFVYIIGYIVYDALMTARRGQTLGKMLLHIRVVRPDGSPVSTSQAWGRAVVRGVMVHLLALVNYLPVFFTNEKTCVHDMAAKTRVVSTD